MYTPDSKNKVKPLGEWNNSRIIFKNGRVEHWLNGKRIIKFKVWSQEWQSRKSEWKWKDYPDYGMASAGRIALQDHGNKA